MLNFLIFTAVISAITLIYIYAGYPTLLWVWCFFKKEREFKKEAIRPDVTLIISCYNEEEVINEKIRNSKNINYPKDKLQILVVSDASDDNTDTIVKSYVDDGIQLIRQDQRLGKTLGLNKAMASATGEIVVFSDANAMYQSDAVIKLVENFSDPEVGYVVGEARYNDGKSSAAAHSEDTYWRYEGFIKKKENRCHSVVGGDGAIYAIRRELYDDLKVTDINDFVNPLQIILKGYRGVYEPEAICYEETSGSFKKEIRRKIRIVNRSFNGLMSVKGVLNPFKTGLFSLEVISHKVLRWFAPVFMLIFAVSAVILGFCNIFIFQLFSVAGLVFLLCAALGHFLQKRSNTWFMFYYPYYFIAVNIASVIGIYKSLRGEVKVTWDTSRVRNEGEPAQTGKVSRYILIASVFVSLLLILQAAQLMGIENFFVYLIFWTSFISILYVYFIYPVVLYIWGILFRKPVSRYDITPEVTLLICAYNEESVIEEKILNSFKIDYPEDKIKIVIASDGSEDKTNEIVESFSDPRLTFVAYKERSGKIGAINKTVPNIKSEIIVFSDANTMYKSDAIRKMVRNFNDPTVGAVSSDVILHNDETVYGKSESLYYKYERWIQKQESMINSIIGADGGMYAIRNELFISPSDNTILDDFVISMNVAINGHRLVYDGDALGYEKSVNSYRTEFSKKSRVIAGAIQSVKRGEGVPKLNQKQLLFSYLSHKFLRWMIPIFMITVFFSNLMICLTSGSPFYGFLFFSQVMFYTSAALGLLWKGPIKISVVYIPFYFCLVNSAALFGIYKGALNKQPIKWKVFRRK